MSRLPIWCCFPACLVAAGLGPSSSCAEDLFLEDFEQTCFIDAPDRYVKDHTVIVGPDGLYHLFYIVGNAGQSWQIPGNEVDFGHATSPDLVHWTARARVIPVQRSGWRSRNVWAPHVVRLPASLGGGYLMAYTGVDSLINQRTGLAFSEDLFGWTDLSPSDAAYAPDSAWAAWSARSTWSAGRDPFLWQLAKGPDDRAGMEWGMLNSAQTRDGFEGLPFRGAISLAVSADGRVWRDAGSPLVVNDDGSILESAHLARNPLSGLWHLFYTRTSGEKGVYYLTAGDPLARWDLRTRTFLTRGSASEIFEALEGTQIFSSFRGYRTRRGQETRGLVFEKLRWTPAGPELSGWTRFGETWELVEGDLGDQPTYHGSGLVETPNGPGTDWFWIHTADDFAGPFQEGNGCSTCPLDDSRTGVLRSRPFPVRGDRMDVWVGGSASSSAYLALCAAGSGEEIFRESGAGTDTVSRRTWDLCELRGRLVRLEIVDADPAGHVVVDRIEERAATPAEPACPSETALRVALAPNPSAGVVTLRLSGALPGRVAGSVFDAAGRWVRRLESCEPQTDEHALRWDGRDDAGHRVPAGVYFVRLLDSHGRRLVDDLRVVRLRKPPPS